MEVRHTWSLVIGQTFLILTLCCCTHWTAGDNHLALKDGELSDLIFTDHLLFWAEVKSDVQCARLCSSNVRCVAFTFSHNRSLSLPCRGHTSLMTRNDVTQPSPGSEYYRFERGGTVGPSVSSPWLLNPCNNNSDCPETNSECFESQCRCTPGYYYSISQDACWADCPASDLQPEFLEYPRSRILRHNLHNYNNTGLEACKTLCVADPRCRSFDLKPNKVKCSTANVTALDRPSDWLTGESKFMHYQIMCA